MSVLPAITALLLATAAPSDAVTPGSSAAPPAPIAADEDQQGAVADAYATAESMQGPLDGLWRLQDVGGRTLYIFSLADTGGAPAPLAASPDHPDVEGAWRDPGRPGAPDASGFLDSVRRQGGWLQIRFVDGATKQPQTVTLRAGDAGRWSGVLAGAGAGQPVVMSRF